MDFDTLILGVAAFLFVIALIALLVWAFKAFFSKSNTSGFLRPRERRLGRGGDGRRRRQA
jgi:flagellar protein FliO/FliZ